MCECQCLLAEELEFTPLTRRCCNSLPGLPERRAHIQIYRRAHDHALFFILRSSNLSATFLVPKGRSDGGGRGGGQSFATASAPLPENEAAPTNWFPEE